MKNPIIFDEYDYARNLLKNGFHTTMSWYDLFVLAKYYRTNGLTNSQIRKELLRFCLKFNPEYNDVIGGRILDSAVKKSEKQFLRLPMDVYITEAEISTIQKIGVYHYEKILFLMLVISRNNKMISKSDHKEYYINHNFSTLLPMAGIYTNKSRRDSIKHDLYVRGFIAVPEPHSKMRSNKKENYKLLYIQENSPTKIIISDFNHICSYYKPLCKNCGKEVDRVIKKSILCQDCYKDKVRKDTLNRVRNFRNRKIDVVTN